MGMIKQKAIRDADAPRHHHGHLCADEDQIRQKLAADNAVLLAALRSVTTQYEAFVEQCCKGQDNRHHDRLIANARAAIKQAS